MLRTKFRKNSIAFSVLKFIAAAAATGVAVGVFAAAPGLAIVARELLEAYEDKDHQARLRRQQRIREVIRHLAKRRLVQYEEHGKETFLVITKDGISEVKKFKFETFAIPAPRRWDGKWRIVVFDIPERYRQGRQALRYKLQALGFYPLQKSVFAFPYECQDEIDFIANFCDVARFVECLLCADLGKHEIKARRHFDLLLTAN